MVSCFYYGEKTGGISMWNMIAHFFSFTAGMTAGVILMCLLQVGKQEDEWMEQLEKSEEEGGEKE